MKPLFLIADDSSAKRDFLERYVHKQMDVDVLYASRTEQAMDIINQHVEIAAAFIDYEIPSEQGPAVIEHLKNHNPNCLIALVSSADCTEYKDKANEAGAEAFVCTSWQLDRVENELNTLLADWNTRIV